ncbi:MAG: hypothetical protein ACREAR_05085 [Nitrosotalea sp.]
MVLNYHKEYTKFLYLCINTELKNIENHLPHYEIIEEMIGFQYWLHETIATLYNSDMEYSKNHVAEALIHELFYHNFLSLHAAFLTTEQSLMHQSVSNLRTIYESIPKMYYASFYPGEIKYMLLKDHMEGRDDTRAMKYLQSENAKLVFTQEELANPKHIINYIEDKYFFKWFNRKIYTDEQIGKSKSTYSLLSISSHGSLIRKQLDKELFEANTGDLFGFIELLSFFNILAELNGHKAMMAQNIISRQEIFDFMEKMRAKLVRDGKMGSLFPDHPDVAKQVMIHPPGSPWD